MALTFEQARQTVLSEVTPLGSAEQVAPLAAAGRVLAEAIPADRDYPPFARSARDGYAIRAADVPGELEIIGEIRAGEIFSRAIGPGQAAEIMTGAPLPPGADAVVMIEHTTREGNRVRIGRALRSGENFNPRGIEAGQGTTLLDPGRRLTPAEIGLLAMTGRERVLVYRQPRVAIVPTGDELVEAGQTPRDFEIRNSNAWSIAAQAVRAGAIPEILPIARDNYGDTRQRIERGFEADLLLLSGGVSAGKYDIVERVLADLGAVFFFDRVLIQPGQPVVFGKAREKFFFGLPGNPISTLITFELFARAAIDRLSGAPHSPLPLLRAKLACDFRHKPGLTRFLPARLSDDGSAIAPEKWHGSGDLAAVARANAFLVADADRESWRAGEDIRVMLK
ncbi:MAG TPA: gephyrin-like molybdotransferase Glp [Bryobacteraceae bacterium]|jgi:molybdopterin molybdotransferase|nr:gephyrin-like molybdotransferase Glp [Bryobacteraceae bacterium]